MNTTEMAQLHLNAQRNLMSHIRASQELQDEAETLISTIAAEARRMAKEYEQ